MASLPDGGYGELHTLTVMNLPYTCHWTFFSSMAFTIALEMSNVSSCLLLVILDYKLVGQILNWS